MWIDRRIEEPKGQTFYNVFGIVNKGSEFEQETSFSAFWNGTEFTDKDGDDFLDLNERITHWFDISKQRNPIKIK
jgi:hypothetical protein